MFFKKKKPYIKFELDGNKINVESYFVNEKEDDKAVEFVKNYSNMLIFIQSGQLLRDINESVAKTSVKNGSYDLSVSINKITTKLLSDFYLHNKNKNKVNDNICIRPEDVFLVRND